MLAFLEAVASLGVVSSSHSSAEPQRLSVSDTDNQLLQQAVITSTKPFILCVSVMLQKYSFTNYPRDWVLISVLACCDVRVGPQEALRVEANDLVLLRVSPC